MSKYLYATIKSGNREYKATPGKVLKYHRVEAEPGEIIEFDQISRVVNGENIILGEPLVEGACVRARVVRHENRKGTIVFRLKRRILYHRKSKHRYSFTRVIIEEIAINDLVLNVKDSDPRKIKKALAMARKALSKSKRLKIPEPIAGSAQSSTSTWDNNSTGKALAAASGLAAVVSDSSAGTQSSAYVDCPDTTFTFAESVECIDAKDQEAMPGTDTSTYSQSEQEQSGVRQQNDWFETNDQAELEDSVESVLENDFEKTGGPGDLSGVASDRTDETKLAPDVSEATANVVTAGEATANVVTAGAATATGTEDLQTGEGPSKGGDFKRVANDLGNETNLAPDISEATGGEATGSRATANEATATGTEDLQTGEGLSKDGDFESLGKGSDFNETATIGAQNALNTSTNTASGRELAGESRESEPSDMPATNTESTVSSFESISESDDMVATPEDMGNESSGSKDDTGTDNGSDSRTESSEPGSYSEAETETMAEKRGFLNTASVETGTNTPVDKGADQETGGESVATNSSGFDATAAFGSTQQLGNSDIHLPYISNFDDEKPEFHLEPESFNAKWAAAAVLLIAILVLFLFWGPSSRQEQPVIAKIQLDIPPLDDPNSAVDLGQNNLPEPGIESFETVVAVTELKDVNLRKTQEMRAPEEPFAQNEVFSNDVSLRDTQSMDKLNRPIGESDSFLNDIHLRRTQWIDNPTKPAPPPD